MKRTMITVALTAALTTTYALLTTLQAAAEPISGVESAADQWNIENKTQDMVEAQGRFKAKDYAGALKLWQEIVKKNADLPPAQVIMAQLYFQSNMPEEGRKALEQAIIDAPKDPEAYLMKGAIAGDLAKSEMLYKKANSLLSTFDKSLKRKDFLQTQLYSHVAGVSEARKDWPETRKTLDEWLKFDPNNPMALRRMAYCSLQQKNEGDALEKLRAAAKLDPRLLSPEILIAQFYASTGDNKNADKWMATALTAAPKDLKTLLAAGKWAMNKGQLDEAQKHADAALQIEPKSLDAMFLRGVTAIGQRDYPAAEKNFESGMKLAPRSPVFSNNLAMVLIQQNDEAKKRRALELAEANVRAYPKSVDFISTYVWVLYRLGRLDEAEKSLRTIPANYISDVDSAYVFACISLDRGRKAEAKQLLETALKKGKPFMFQQEIADLLEKLKK